jgi:hypothetical protein
MGSGGAIAFQGWLGVGQGGLDSSNAYGIWAEQADSLNLLARSGSAAPGMPAGIKFSFFGDEPAVNGPGQVAFVAYLVEGSGGVTSENSGAVFSNTSGALSLLVREGAQAPGAPPGAMFSNYLGLNQRDSGNLVFIGFLKTGSGGVTTSNDRGIWLNGSGAMTLIAREGQQAPGLPTGAKFGHVFLGDPLVNGAGKVLFRSNLTTGSGGVTAGNDYSIWSNAYGSLSLVAREGDPAPGATDGAVFQDFDDYAFNSLGQIAIWATVSGGVSGNESGVWMTNPQGKLTLVARTGGTLEVAPGDIGTITGAGFRGVFSAAKREYQALNDSGELLLSFGYVSNSQLRSGLFVASFYDTTVKAIEILESEFVPTALGGEFQLLVQVQPAAHYRVEDSGDLKVWSDYLEFTATEEQKVLVVPTRKKVPDNSRYFFRIRRD